MVDKLYVVEWSNKQRCFHIQTLIESMKSAQECAANRIENDWSILFATESYAAASNMCDHFKESLNLPSFTWADFETWRTK